MKFKSILKNKNIILMLYILILTFINNFICNHSITEGTKIYNILRESMALGPVQQMEEKFSNFFIWNPIWVILALVIFLIVVFTSENLFTTDKLTKTSKYLLLPFALIFSLYIAYATVDLVNTNEEIIKELSVKNQTVDIIHNNLQTEINDNIIPFNIK